MRPLTETPPAQAADAEPERPNQEAKVAVAGLPLWRIHLLRLGYAFTAGGILAVQWPTLLNHDSSWPLFVGVKASLLAAVSVLALLGIRHPVQMLPVLLFEVTWKAIWFAAVAAPLWAAGGLDPATHKVASDCLWVVVVVAVIPWRFVLKQYVMKRGDRWRSRPTDRADRPVA